MTKQRLISDARRRARALSVETGRPYQSHLDDVARMAGHIDWKEFLLDPAPIPAAPAMTSRTDDTADENTMSAAHARGEKPGPRRIHRLVPRMVLGLVILTLTLLVWDAWSRSGRAGNLGAVFGEERQIVDRLDLDLTAVNWKKGRFYTVAKALPGDRREVLITVLDSRSGSFSPIDWSYNHLKSYMYHKFGVKLGFVPYSLAFYDHPLFRGRFEVSCTSGRARLLAGELADSFAGAPVRRIPNNEPKTVVFDHDQTAALCARSLLESSAKVRALWITDNSAEEYTYAWE